MSSDSAHVAVGCVGESLYLGFHGRATQRVCPTAEQLLSDYLSSHKKNPTVILDLDGCGWVDSTFAGWMVSWRRRLERKAGGELLIAGCSERCRASLDKMHLGVLFQFGTCAAPAELREVPCTTGDRPDKAALQLMLEAHEELAGIDAENQRVFSPIVDTLRQQLEKGQQSIGA